MRSVIALHNLINNKESRMNVAQPAKATKPKQDAAKKAEEAKA